MQFKKYISEEAKQNSPPSPFCHLAPLWAVDRNCWGLFIITVSDEGANPIENPLYGTTHVSHLSHLCQSCRLGMAHLPLSSLSLQKTKVLF